MKTTSNMLTVLLISLTLTCVGKTFYVKQKLMGSNSAGQTRTSFQETYVSDDLTIIIDEVTKQYINDSLYVFYNLTDSTFYQKKFSDMDEVTDYANSQIQGFTITESNKKTKVGKWETQLYYATAKVMNMEMDIEMYISKDTGLPTDVLFRSQEKMHKKASNIMDMMSKIKNTGGIVVKEIAKIGGQVVSVKEITATAIINEIDDKIKMKPKGFTEMKK